VGGGMVFGTYRELFAAVATVAAALTGLLFVAISVARQPTRDSPPDVIRQIRAAASLLSFTNPLAVTLFGLVPGTNVGYPAIALGSSACCAPVPACGPSWVTPRRGAGCGAS